MIKKLINCIEVINIALIMKPLGCIIPMFNGKKANKCVNNKVSSLLSGLLLGRNKSKYPTIGIVLTINVVKIEIYFGSLAKRMTKVSTNICETEISVIPNRGKREYSTSLPPIPPA
jgi:hypothetical protein